MCDRLGGDTGRYSECDRLGGDTGRYSECDRLSGDTAVIQSVMMM